MIDQKSVAAIVLTAGEGRRYASTSVINKTFEPLLGTPVFMYSVLSFDAHPSVDRLIVAARPDQIPEVSRLLSDAALTKPWEVIPGGASRRDSVLACLRQSAEDYVIIQDGARPMLRRRYITEALTALSEYPGATIAVPASDTVKLADENLCVKATPPRACVWLVQTPQAFHRERLLQAHLQLDDPSLATDDCVVLERLGERVRLLRGDTDNRKLTFPEDKEILSASLRVLLQETP